MAGSQANQQTKQPIVVTHQGGVRFAAQVRAHRVVVDQPVRGGGDDTAPTPLELLGASLGTCVALYVQQFCASRGIAFEGMRVEVEPVGAASANRIARFKVRVVLPVPLPEQVLLLIDRVARSCPAGNTLHHGADVSVTVEAPVAAATA